MSIARFVWLGFALELSACGEHYEGGHWLGTFAVYLLTRRGL